MRKGSAAIVPLFLAIMLLFWLMTFMGGESDNIHKVNKLTNLHHVQDKLLIAAMNKRYDLVEKYENLYSEKNGFKKELLNKKVSDDIHFMMKKNKIDN